MNEKIAAEIGQFRAIRERLRTKLVIRSKGMFTSPFDQQPLAKSITATRARPFSTMTSNQKDKALPHLYDTREWTRRPSTTEAAPTAGEPKDNKEEAAPTGKLGGDQERSLPQNEAQAAASDVDVFVTTGMARDEDTEEVVADESAASEDHQIEPELTETPEPFPADESEVKPGERAVPEEAEPAPEVNEAEVVGSEVDEEAGNVALDEGQAQPAAAEDGQPDANGR
jgi:hypothetical protein